MTKEEWEQVENEMLAPFGHVKLKIDGYDVSLGFVAVAGFRWEIAVYVNGKIRDPQEVLPEAYKIHYAQR